MFVHSAFLPQVEPYVSEMCFLPASPLELGRDPWSKDIDVIFGGTANECIAVLSICPDEKGMDEINRNPGYLLPRDLKETLDMKIANTKGIALKQLYFGEKDISTETKEHYVTVSFHTI